MNAVFDHIVAILVVGAIFVGAVVVLPSINLSSLQAVDQQQLKNTALNVFNTMLLDEGQPYNWGALDNFQMNDSRVKRFGLSKAQESSFYVLDPDKVQRLVYENPLNYLTYDKTQQLLGLQDYGFRLRIIPPFNVTLNSTANGNILNYHAKVEYLAGDPIPNAKAVATVVYTKGSDIFNITTSEPSWTNALGTCEGTVTLSVSDPDYYLTTLRVTVADVATLVVKSGQTFNNSIANINVVYDTIFLTGTKGYSKKMTVWILDIVAFGSQGQLWYLLEGTKTSEDKFNTGGDLFNLWQKAYLGLHDFEPILLIFNFWAYDPETNSGRQQVLVVVAYPDLFGTNIFEYGGTPSKGTPIVNIQRSVVISHMIYTAELWFWDE